MTCREGARYFRGKNPIESIGGHTGGVGLRGHFSAP